MATKKKARKVAKRPAKKAAARKPATRRIQAAPAKKTMRQPVTRETPAR